PSWLVSALFDEGGRGFDPIPQAYGSEEFLGEGLLLLSALTSQNVAPTLLPAVGRRLMEPMAQLPHLASIGPLAADATRNGRVWRGGRGGCGGPPPGGSRPRGGRPPGGRAVLWGASA